MKLLDKNLALLSKRQPSLATRIERASLTLDLKTGVSKNGLPTLKVNNLSLHSWFDPLSEAIKITDPVVAKDRIYIFGFGFGYHLTELLKKCSELVVIEPSVEILKVAMEHIDFSHILPQTEIIVSENSCKIAADIVCSSVPLFVHPGTSRIFPESFNAFSEAFEAASTIPALRVLVVGPVYGGSLPTAQYLNQSLVEMGHKTSFVDSSLFSDSFHKIDRVTENKRAESCIRNKYNEFLGEMIIARAVDFAPDLIIAVAQAPLSGRTLERLKQADIPIAFWFVEDFRTLTYWKEIGPHYDYFFPIQQGEFTSLLNKAGVKNTHYLPQACFPPLHKEVSISDTEKSIYGSDLSFFGAGYYNRQKFFQALTEFDFRIWGSEWNRSASLYSHVQMDGKRLEPAEYTRIFTASTINLNLHSSLFHEGVDPSGDFVNPRTFEIASCGAFQLVDYRSELPELFELDIEVVCFRDLPELKEKIGYYLTHDEERYTLSQNARKRAIKEHTFASRLTLLLTIVWLNDKKRIESSIAQRDKKRSSVNSIGQMLEDAGSDPELSRFLSRFKKSDSISLKKIMEAITEGEGPISRTEALFIMINEILTEKT